MIYCSLSDSPERQVKWTAAADTVSTKKLAADFNRNAPQKIFNVIQELCKNLKDNFRILHPIDSIFLCYCVKVTRGENTF